MELLIATTNHGKVREIARALAGVPLTIRTLADVPSAPEPEETGRTFAENAREKANYYGARFRGLTVAEDSGLVIDALDGRPGILSARYPGATYAAKFAGLYRELASHAQPWTARFVCSLAVVRGDDPATVIFACEGTIEGEISREPSGTHGFGYDPIFFYPPYGRTLGNVGDDEKLAVSHRGQAFTLLRDWLLAPERREATSSVEHQHF